MSWLPKTYYIFFFCLLACGQPENMPNKKIDLALVDIAALLEKQDFQCNSLDGRDCPEGLARVFVINAKNSANSIQCAGFLTASNKLVTNHHCLSTSQQCQNTYVSVYGKTGFETARCKSIISTHTDLKPLAHKAKDVTVMELDTHLKILPLETRIHTPAIGSNISVWAVDHLSRNEARLTQLSCKTIAHRNSIELEHCPIVAGNSGSPVINGEGQVVGVVWGSSLPDTVSEKMDLQKRRALEATSYATDMKYFKSHAIP